ncbi:MAG: VirB4 family type IV secretion/conjugal transfer ATPase, partial [Novosphingobium sp.]
MGILSGAAAWAKKEAHAGDRLPYLALVDENVVLLRDGSVMLSLMVPGLAFETADTDELNAHTAAREVLLRSALDSRFVLYHHVIRRRVEVGLDGTFDDPLAAHIDTEWKARLASGALFINDQFVTLVRRPARGKAGLPEKLSRLWKRRGADSVTADPADLRALHAAAQAMVASLGAYGARLLGDYQGASGPCSEVLELLSALYNGEMRPVRRPAEGTDIGRMLPYRRTSFGLDAMERRGAEGADFSALVSLKDYPDSTAPGLTDALLRLPCELVLSESYAPSDRQLSRERIDLALRRLRSADEEAMAERREMVSARDALGTGSVGFGDHHLSVLVRAPTLPALDATAAACAAALADAGAIAVREDVNLEPGFWGQFPGNESYIVRRALISSANMACFGSLHGFALGQAHGNHWGEAVTLLQTTSSTPFFFN